MTITKTLRYGKGYAGKLGNRCWIAEITGMDSGYGFAREFLDADSVEREHFNRPRTIVNLTWELPEGLYEASAEGDRWFFAVVQPQDEGAESAPVSAERARLIAQRLDDDEPFGAAWDATHPVTR